METSKTVYEIYTNLLFIYFQAKRRLMNIIEHMDLLSN